MVFSKTPQAAAFLQKGLLPLFLLVAAFVVRAWGASLESIWADDYLSYAYLKAPDLRRFFALIRYSNPEQMPLYFLLQYGWGRLAGVTPETIRAISITAGALSAPLLYFAARRWLGTGAAFLAGCMMALSPIHIYHSQGMRAYALLVLLGIISLLAYERVMNSPKHGWWGAALAVNSALVFTHLTGFFLVAAQGAGLLLSGRRGMTKGVLWGMLHLPLALLCLLWMATSPIRIGPAEEYLNPMTLAEVWGDWTGFDTLRFNPEIKPTLYTAPPHATDIPLANKAAATAAPVVAAFFSVVLVLAWVGLAKKWRIAPIDRGGWLFLATAATLPTVTTAAVTYSWEAWITPRYLLMGMPALYMLAAAAVTNRKIPRPLVLLLTVTLTMCIALQTRAMLGATERTDWRGCAEIIRSNALSGDHVYVTGGPCPRFILSNPTGRDDLHFHSAMTLAGALTHAADSLRNEGRKNGQAWIATLDCWPKESMDSFEKAVSSLNLSHEKWLFPAMEGIWLYRLEGTAQREIGPLLESWMPADGYEAIFRELDGFFNPAEKRRHEDTLRRIFEPSYIGFPRDALVCSVWAVWAALENDPVLGKALAEKAVSLDGNHAVPRLAAACVCHVSGDQEGAKVHVNEAFNRDARLEALLGPLVSALEKKDLSAVAAEVQILERSGFPARYLVDNGRQP